MPQIPDQIHNPPCFASARITGLFLILTSLLSIHLWAIPLPHTGDSDGSSERAPYWVFFKDKGFTSAVDKNAALESFHQNLSKRALNRRMKVAVSDPVTADDLPPATAYLSTISKLADSPPRVVSRWLNAASYRLSLDQVHSLKDLEFVREIRPVKSFQRSEPRFFDEDKNPAPQPHRDHDLDYGASLEQNAFVKAPDIHDLGYFGAGVIIGVTDAGFSNLEHDCFSDINVLDAWDFVNDDPNVDNEDDAGNGSHGIRVLSTMAGFDPGNFIGVAPQAEYVLAKTENTEVEQRVEEDYLVAALEWMDTLGVDIVNISLSYSDFYDWDEFDGNTAVTTIAADRAVAAGMVVLAAAGNSGRERYPRNKVGTPAEGDSVFAIGSTTIDSVHSYFSSFGPTYDGRIKPDLCTMGSSVAIASAVTQDGYSVGSGTSFSTPIVSGLCALLLGANPDLTPMELGNVLRSVSDRADNPDTLYGWGIPNGLDALHLVLQLASRQTVVIEPGWNLISTYLDVDISFGELFEDMIRRQNFIAALDSRRGIFRPELNIDELHNWQPLSGYYVKVSRADSVVFHGDRIHANGQIELDAGWNIVSYLPDVPSSVEVAFQLLADSGVLEIVHDDRGGFYVPVADFANMRMLKPGEGYRLFLTQQASFVYPAVRNDHIEVESPLFTGDYAYDRLTEIGDRFVIIRGEGVLLDGDIVMVRDLQGNQLAQTVISGRVGGVILPPAGDEETSWVVKSHGVEHYVQVKQMQSHSLGANTGEYRITAVESQPVGFSAILLNADPNPFNDNLQVRIENPGSEQVSFTVYDLMGRKVHDYQPVASHTGAVTFNLDASGWASGPLILEAVSGDYSSRRVLVHSR